MEAKTFSLRAMRKCVGGDETPSTYLEKDQEASTSTMTIRALPVLRAGSRAVFEVVAETVSADVLVIKKSGSSPLGPIDVCAGKLFQESRQMFQDLTFVKSSV
jgi:hypothetical protein